MCNAAVEPNVKDICLLDKFRAAAFALKSLRNEILYIMDIPSIRTLFAEELGSFLDSFIGNDRLAAVLALC